ncbi:MAG: DUF2269 family protein [Ktedonobacterales bacterium]|nr:DUF2269 family protein [Ktedonobacterales bacterium]
MVYALVLFLHIVGALGFFGSLLLWVAVLTALRRAHRVEEVRPLVALVLRSQVGAMSSIVVLLLAGVVMTLMAWQFTTDWIVVALGTLVLIAPISPLFIEPRLRAIATLAKAAPDGPLTDTLNERIHHPLLITALYLLVPLLLGIVFLMVVKPSLSGAVVVMAGAGILGMLCCFPFWVTPPLDRHPHEAERLTRKERTR